MCQTPSATSRPGMLPELYVVYFHPAAAQGARGAALHHPLLNAMAVEHVLVVALQLAYRVVYFEVFVAYDARLYPTCM